ncbi:MAG: hypothetical protein WA655_05725 [Candidatus Korobacteraceae bacterium]
MMRILATLFILSAGLAFAQQNHDAMLHQHGDQVMGFSHDKTTHHFELTQDGGVIEVRTNDVADAASREEIQKHFHHIAQMFAAGNFAAPMLVHDRKDVPGTATMAALKDKLHWQLEETARGAKLTVVADNKEALDAVHDFLRFQIADHQTGDCTAVR